MIHTSGDSGTSDLVFLLTFSGASVASDFTFLGVGVEEADCEVFFLTGVAELEAFFTCFEATFEFSVSAIVITWIEDREVI